MVGSVGAIHPRGATELRHHQNDGFPPRFAQGGFESVEAVVELRQRLPQAIVLSGMGVPSTYVEGCDAWPVRPRNIAPAAAAIAGNANRPRSAGPC